MDQPSTAYMTPLLITNSSLDFDFSEAARRFNVFSERLYEPYRPNPQLSDLVDIAELAAAVSLVVEESAS